MPVQYMRFGAIGLEPACEPEGLDFGAVIKTSIFLTDMAFFSEVNSEYAKWFKADFPARETVQVSGLPKGVRVEISMIAFYNK